MPEVNTLAAAFARLSRLVADAGRDCEKSLPTITRQAAEMIGEGCIVYLVSPDGRSLLPKAWHCTDRRLRVVLGKFAFANALPLGAGHAGRVFLSGKPAFIPRVDTAEMLRLAQPDYRAYLERDPIHSLMIFPLKVEGEAIGTMNFWRHRADRPYTADERRTAQSLADMVALGVSQCRQAAEIGAEVDGLHRLEQALAESEERFRAIFETSFDAVGIFEEGRLVLANPALSDLSGYTPEELLGKPALDLIAPENRELCMRHMRAGYDRPYEAAGLRKDGAAVPGEVCGRAFRAGNRELRAVTIRDLRERRRAAEAQRQLFHAQKMEAVGRLAGGVAHDFSNVLCVVLGYLRYLEREHQGPPRSEYLQKAVDAAEFGAALASQFEVFSRRGELQPVPLDLRRIVKGMRGILRGAAGERVRLVLRLAPGVPAVKADPDEIQRVFLNLALNARDAMPEGGVLEIRAVQVEVRPHEGAWPAAAAPGRYLHVTVADTGLGMTAEVAGRAFEPFFTTKAVGHGTGLGLATVYGIVQRLAGHVWLDTAPGQGTRVHMLLPATEEPPLPVPPPEASERYAGRGQVVLVVDKDHATRALCCEVLESVGYRVLQARDVREALALSGERQGLIHLLVAGHGRNIAARLRERTPSLAVLCLCSGSRPCAHDGLCVRKPFTREELLVAVRAALERRLEA